MEGWKIFVILITVVIGIIPIFYVFASLWVFSMNLFLFMLFAIGFSIAFTYDQMREWTQKIIDYFIMKRENRLGKLKPLSTKKENKKKSQTFLGFVREKLDNWVKD